MHTWAQLGPFGGHTFLDFVNTVDDELKSRSRNALPDWPTVFEWADSQSILDRTEAEALAKMAVGEAAAVEYSNLMDLKETAWIVLSNQAGGIRSAQQHLDALRDAVQWSIAHSSLEPDDRSLHWSPGTGELGLGLVRARLGLSFLDLTLSPELHRLRECGRCTGLFLDQGRGRGRKWCRMETCGNRAKVERFRDRH